MGKEERRSSARIQAVGGGRRKTQKKQKEPIIVDDNDEPSSSQEDMKGGLKVDKKAKDIGKKNGTKRKMEVEKLIKCVKDKVTKNVEKKIEKNIDGSNAAEDDSSGYDKEDAEMSSTKNSSGCKDDDKVVKKEKIISAQKVDAKKEKKRKAKMDSSIEDEEADKDDDYLMTSTRRGKALKIQLNSKTGTMSIIKTNLGEKYEAAFRRTCFGHFWDFSFKKTSSQLLMHLIQHQCKPKKTWEMNFKIGGKMLTFGLREFALVTGLNCGPLLELDKDKMKGEGKLKEDYFEDEGSLKRSYLNMAFKVNKNGTENDMIKMALLYCLESFLLPRQEKVNIEMDHILMVDDEELFHNYPWGRVAFQLLANYMKKAVVSKGGSCISMGGCVYALLAWAYEVIPALSSPPTYYAKRIRDTYPRIINWEAESHTEWRELQNKVFGSDELEVKSLEPTTEEMMMPYFGPFLEAEMDKRRLGEAKAAILSENMVGHNLLKGSPSIVERLECIEKRQDEIINNQEDMHKKLDVVVLSVNLVIKSLQNAHNDKSPEVNIQTVDTTIVELVAKENEKSKTKPVDDHGIEKPIRTPNDDEEGGPRGGNPQQPAVNVNTGAQSKEPKAQGGTTDEAEVSNPDGTVQEDGDEDAKIDELIRSINESEIMEKMNKDNERRIAMGHIIPKSSTPHAGGRKIIESIKIPELLGKKLQKRQALSDVNGDMHKESKIRRALTIGYVDAGRGMNKIKTTEVLPNEFNEPSFDLKLSQIDD